MSYTISHETALTNASARFQYACMCSIGAMTDLSAQRLPAEHQHDKLVPIDLPTIRLTLILDHANSYSSCE